MRRGCIWKPAELTVAEIRGAEISLIFAHYDYFTGRAIRILLTLEGTRANLEAAATCIDIARREKVWFVSRHAQRVANDAYSTWHERATDLQLKVLGELARSSPSKVQVALLAVLERELSCAQTSLPTT